MDSLNVKEYSVIGWSDGANSAVLLAASRPKVCQKYLQIKCRSRVFVSCEHEFE